MSDRIQPFNEEAERAVLGSVLIPGRAGELLDLYALKGLAPSGFFVGAHEIIYAAMLDVQNRGREVDFVSLTAELKRLGKLDECGGPFLERLVDSTPTAAHAEYYLDIVLADAMRRKIIAASREVMDKAYSREDEAEILRGIAEEKFASIRHEDNAQRTAGDLLKEQITRWEQAREVGCAGTPTGFRIFDRYFGGLMEAAFYVFSGEAGCLRGDTPIYDPSDNTNYSVRERWLIGKPFNVFSLSASCTLQVAEAMPPVRYPEAKMYRVETSESTFYVTGEHRFLLDTGEYLSLTELISRKYGRVRLPSTLASFPKGQLQDGLRSTGTARDYSKNCSHDSRLCDEQPPFVTVASQEHSPLQVGVLGRIRGRLPVDGLEGEEARNQTYRQFFRHSKMGYSSRPVDESLACLSDATTDISGLDQHQISSQELLEFRRSYIERKSTRHPLAKDFSDRMDKHQAYADIHLLACSAPVVGRSSFTVASINRIEQVVNEEYFDFHVPFYENYLAGGVFHHNCGKTTLARNIAENLAMRGEPAAIFTMEQTAGQIWGSVAARQAKQSVFWLNMGSRNADIERVAQAAIEVQNWPLYIDDTMMTPTTLWSACRRAVSKHGCKLLVLDYLQQLMPDRKYGSQEEMITHFSATCRQIAKTLRVPFIVISALSNEGRTRGSGMIGYDAWAHVRLTKSDEWRSGKLVVDVHFDKQRFGPPAQDEKLTLIGDEQRFEEAPICPDKPYKDFSETGE